jgi:hypothetical protein
MSTYVIEAYIGDGLTRELSDRARHTAESMRDEGYAIRYLRTLVMPADETCFHVLEAASADDAALLAQRAQLALLRIVEAEEWTKRHAHAHSTTKERR